MAFPRMNAPLPWILLGLGMILLLHFQDQSSIRSLENLQSIHTLPLPSRVIFDATLSNIRSSGTALVFDASNQGKVTCYWRHPAPFPSLFTKDNCRIQARIEQTLRGRLCVVERVSACARV
ncbi:MAG: hypothetical protein Q8P05_05860 [Candidatus Diapherotrites archaeon]|nr:hypothetical protein [Candidatus Diapherotrites archaeon]MDZ4256593.1 hypothetical protein [archaeon]